MQRTRITAGIIIALFLASTFTLAFSVAPAAATTNGSIVGLWHFDEGAGNIAYDSSGCGNDGTLHNFVSPHGWTTDKKFGSHALDFDGFDDYISVGYDPSLDITDAITIESWVKLDVLKENNYILQRYQSSPSGVGAYGIRCGLPDFSPYGEDPDHEKIQGWIFHANTIYTSVSTKILTTGVWHHIAMTYDKGDPHHKIKLYFDGSEVTYELQQAVPSPYTIDTETSDLWIGQIINNYYLDGVVDEARLWSRALAADEIAGHATGIYRVGWLPPVTNADFVMQDGTTLPLKFQIFDGSDNLICDETSGLGLAIVGALGGPADAHTVGLWHFDEGSGTTAQDSSGNGNDGAISGATWTTEGVCGSALEFDGTDDYVRVSHVSELNPTSEITVECWAKFDRVNDHQVLVRKMNTYSLQVSVGLNGAGARLEGWVKIGEVWKGVRGVAGGRLIESGKWYHLAFTYDGAMLTTYVNGMPDRSNSFTGAIDSTENDIDFGRCGPPEATYCHTDGIIDEVRISDVARTFWSEAFSPKYDMSECYYIVTFHTKDYNLGEGWYMATVDISGDVIDSIVFELSPSKGVGRGNSGKSD